MAWCTTEEKDIFQGHLEYRTMPTWSIPTRRLSQPLLTTTNMHLYITPTSTNCTMMDSQENQHMHQTTNLQVMEVHIDHRLLMMNRLLTRVTAHQLTVHKIHVQEERNSLQEIMTIFLLLANLEGLKIRHHDWWVNVILMMFTGWFVDFIRFLDRYSGGLIPIGMAKYGMDRYVVDMFKDGRIIVVNFRPTQIRRSAQDMHIMGSSCGGIT